MTKLFIPLIICSFIHVVFLLCRSRNIDLFVSVSSGAVVVTLATQFTVKARFNFFVPQQFSLSILLVLFLLSLHSVW